MSAAMFLFRNHIKLSAAHVTSMSLPLWSWYATAATILPLHDIPIYVAGISDG